MKSKARIYDSWQQECLQTLILLTLLVLFISETQAKDKPYPGELYDIGTHRLHMHCMGEGSPTIVIDSGAGGFSLEWINIQYTLAEQTRVCSYDRAGYGFSDAGPLPRTSAQITFELKKLLTAANIPGPYVMVGHSFGGYNIRYFATLYPEDVAGMVLVDSSHPQQFNTEAFKRVSVKEQQEPKYPNSYRIRSIRPVIAANYPIETRQKAFVLMLSWKSKATLIDELDNMEISAQELLAQEEFKAFDFPVVIISRGKRVWPHNELGDLRERQWEWLQNDLENISTQSYHVVARNSGHIVHLDQPEMVASNISFAVDRAKTYYNEKQMIEKFDIRLAHFGAIQNTPVMAVNYAELNVPEHDFFELDRNFRQVMFNGKFNPVQTFTENLLY